MKKRYDGLYINAFVLKSYNKELIESYFYELYKQTKDDCGEFVRYILTSRYKREILKHLGIYDSYLEDMCDRFLRYGYRLALNKDTGYLEWLRLK